MLDATLSVLKWKGMKILLADKRPAPGQRQETRCNPISVTNLRPKFRSLCVPAECVAQAGTNLAGRLTLLTLAIDAARCLSPRASGVAPHLPDKALKAVH